jgi:hypothetical protein
MKLAAPNAALALHFTGNGRIALKGRGFSRAVRMEIETRL